MSGLLARLVLTSRATLDTAGATRTQVVSRQRGGSALNPEISATGDFRLIGQRHGDLRGETPEVEVALQSTLDPYSTAKFIVGLSSEEVAVEEGYLYYTGLPGRLRADLGLIRQQVGDLNRWHLHALPESEYPLVYQRFLSPEGLSGAGLSLYHRIARFAAPWHPRSLVAGDHRRERAPLWRRPPWYAAGPGAELLAALPEHLRPDRIHRARREQRGHRAGPGPGLRLRGRRGGTEEALTPAFPHTAPPARRPGSPPTVRT